MNTDIRVIVVDDHAIVREGIKSLLELEPDITHVSEASSSSECMKMLDADNSYHVILMDLKMPGIDGIEATRLIKAQYPNIKVVILTNYDDDEFVLEAIKVGADGYVLKDVRKVDLLKIIHDVLENRGYIDPAVTPKVFDRLKRTSISTSEDSHVRPVLSQRELQVLEQLVEGKSNKEIADSIYVSLDTVKAHLKSIYKKLGVCTRAQAAKAAIQEEIIHISHR
ncbi:MAG: response regulator [Desulfomonilia bacterium]